MKKLIVANWKMNPDTPREARRLFRQVKRAASRLRRVTAVICPPAIFLPILVGKPAKNLALGGQDISTELRGAHTGSISAPQIKYAGADYVILGHSERRRPLSALGGGGGDTDDSVNNKVRLALKTGLRIILCVGETARDARGDYLAGLRAMLEHNLARVARAELKNLVVVYEPVWTIGGRAAEADTPEDFLEHSLFLRKVLAGRFGRAAAMTVPVLYGGSVAPENAADFLGRGEAAGLLVGHESLRADRFNAILRVADSL